MTWLSQTVEKASKSKPLTWIARLIALIIFVALGLKLIAYPFQVTWDGIAYLGSIAELQGKSVDQIHQFAYKQTRLGDTKQYYESLIDDPQYYATHPYTPDHIGSLNYRKVCAQNPVAFYQQLPFYSSRRGYFLSIEAFHALGASWAGAMRANMVIPNLIFLAVAFATIAFSFDAVGILGLSLLFAFLQLYKGTPSHSTPDALGLLFDSLAILLGPLRKYLIPCLIFASIGTMIRPDSLLLVLALAGMAFYFYRDLSKKEKIFVAAIAIGMVLYVYVIQKLSHTYPMQTLYYHTFVHRLAYPALNKSGITVSHYFRQLFGQVFQLGKSMRYIALLSILLFVFYVKCDQRYRWTSFAFWVGNAVAVFHFLIFPMYDDRYFDFLRVTVYVTLGCIYLQWMRDRAQNNAVAHLRPAN